MKPETAEDALAGLELFAGLAPSVLARLAGAMRERALAAGELLCGRGDAGDRLFVVLAGRLRVSVLTSEGRELSMRIAGPGEMVGEIAVFDGGVRTTDMTAIEPARVSALPAEAFFKALALHPEIARNALKMLCRRVRDTTAQARVPSHSIQSSSAWRGCYCSQSTAPKRPPAGASP